MSVTMSAVAQGIIDDALADTKAWLRIETAFDDAAIAALLRSAIGMAEDFCAQMMFARPGVETIAATSAWTRLRACPVRAITGARSLAADGTATVLAVDGYAVDISADGDGWARVTAPGSDSRVEYDVMAGIAADWASLPDALRQGSCGSPGICLPSEQGMGRRPQS